MAPTSRTTTPGGYSSVQATTPTFAVRPPGASYPQTSYGYTPGVTAYAPPPPPSYTQYQSSYYAGYAASATPYHARAAAPQYNSGWSSYHHYGQPSGPRYTVGSVYTAPNVATQPQHPNLMSSQPQASSSQSQTASDKQVQPMASSSQPPSARSEPSLISGDRPAYTTMAYQPYSSAYPYGITSYPTSTPTSASNPVASASSATSTPPATTHSLQPTKPYSTTPTFSATTGSAFTANPQQAHPYVAPPSESSAPTAGTSLKWQRPYEGPKPATKSTSSSHASTPQPQPQPQPSSVPPYLSTCAP